MAITIKCKLLCKEHDIGGYITYVFQNLEETSFGKKYLMVTQWKNWEHRELDIGEIGYLSYKEVIEGQDTWFDGSKFIPYNYSNIIFIKFIKEQEVDNFNKDIIL